MDNIACPTGLLARFRRVRGGRVSEQDLLIVPTSAVPTLEGERDLSGWGRLDLPMRPGLVPVALSLFLSPILGMALSMGGEEDGDGDVDPPIPSMASARVRPQRWPRGLPCPVGLDDDDDD